MSTNIEAERLIQLFKMNSSFRNDIYKLVNKIPPGKVVTYGQIALACGHPGAARVVGQVAHFGPAYLPWHRLVKAGGYMAAGFVPGGPNGQAKLLAQEGIVIKNNKINSIEKYIWIM